MFVYYKAFSSSTTKHGFLGAGVIDQPLSTVLCMLKDASKRHLYDKTITTAQVHKKITSNIELGEYFLRLQYLLLLKGAHSSTLSELFHSTA